MSYKKEQKDRMLISETSAALPFTRFRGLARVPDIRANVPSSACVPGVAHFCSTLMVFATISVKLNAFFMGLKCVSSRESKPNLNREPVKTAFFR